MARQPTASSCKNFSEAHGIASIGGRAAISAALLTAASPYRAFFKAILAQYDGHVDMAVAGLQRLTRRSEDLDVRATCADFLAAIFMSRNRINEVIALCDLLDEAGHHTDAFAFRALHAARAKSRESARGYAHYALATLNEQDDELLRARIFQRLALAAFYQHDFELAMERARASAAIAEKIRAYRLAAASYTIIYSVHHEVTGDFAEASRHASLWREAAVRAGDVSMLHAALAAEYELAVQFADSERIEILNTELKSTPLPQAYYERYPMILSHALVLGFNDMVAMRTVLSVLRDTAEISRGEWALCSALIALSYAAVRDDDRARDELKSAISRLGRSNTREPAYEQQYRRIARGILATCCIMLGDHVHANRIVSVTEMNSYPAAKRLPALAYSNELHKLDASLRGVGKVIAHALKTRSGATTPAGLTDAELEVLQLLGRGWTAIRIASETARSVNTIYSHTRAILGKLNASRAPEAVAIARSLQIIP